MWHISNGHVAKRASIPSSEVCMTTVARKAGGRRQAAPDFARRVAGSLGVPKIRAGRDSAVAIHEVVSSGLPGRALLKAMRTAGIPASDLLPVFGISERTLQRVKDRPDVLLNSDRSGRVWRFTEILTKTEDVLGSKERAVEWLQQPAMALESRRPIDLLTTQVGAQLVDDVIQRMRYGVYQ
jgi:putative toxin-antitoxin system antitoxin component (TIGR02293 family)